jgi:hypothetical protein
MRFFFMAGALALAAVGDAGHGDGEAMRAEISNDTPQHSQLCLR